MEEIQESRVRRKALLPKSKPTLFLYEGDSQKHSKMIGNVRYVTVSHYSSDKKWENSLQETFIQMNLTKLRMKFR